MLTQQAIMQPGPGLNKLRPISIIAKIVRHLTGQQTYGKVTWQGVLMVQLMVDHRLRKGSAQHGLFTIYIPAAHAPAASTDACASDMAGRGSTFPHNTHGHWMYVIVHSQNLCAVRKCTPAETIALLFR